MEENTSPQNPEENQDLTLGPVEPTQDLQPESDESMPIPQGEVQAEPAAENPEPINNAPSKTQSDTPIDTSSETSNDAPNETPKPELTPEEKKARKKEGRKRIAIIGSTIYGVILLLVIVWAFVVGTKELDAFNYLPISQLGFSNFLWSTFNILAGALAVILLLVSTLFVIKALLTKKTDELKKKKGNKKALFLGLAFFLATLFWLVGVIILGPRLVMQEVFRSYILTDPVSTIGLSAPINIDFDASDLPVGDNYEVLSYVWDFGDGESATGLSVAHRYTTKGIDGRFTVVLTVELRDRSDGGITTEEFTKEVSIDNETVAAGFTSIPDSGDAPLLVSFNASDSYDGDGEIVSYEWDFNGDGRFDDGEGEVVEYEFTQEGSFNVTLRVTDNNGDFDVAEDTIEVGSTAGLKAVITSEDVAEGDDYYLETKYNFTGQFSQTQDEHITRYTWDFGDGSTTVQSRNSSHSYEEVGIYTLTLSIQDADGNEDLATQIINVVEEGSSPTANIEADQTTGSVPLTVSFDATSSIDPDEDIIDYEWDFDEDGLSDESGDVTTYTFEEVGTYQVTLTTTDSIGNTDTEIIEIVVTEQGVVAKLEIDSSNGEVPLTVSFDASSSTFKEGNILSYEFDFGDGSDPYIGGAQVTYKYQEIGNFEASVSVIGDDGSSNTATVQIVVRPVAMTACFTVNVDDGNSPLFVSVDPSCSTGTIDAYAWDFGDDSISFDRKPETHVYQTQGLFTIELEVTGDSGVVSTFTKDIVVN
jgi:PKD repeat protein